MIHVTVIHGPLPLRDKNGILNPNYRMYCLCGRTVNIATDSDEFAEKTRVTHINVVHIKPVFTDPFEGL